MKIILVCSPLRFYTQTDESFLFKWLKKIKSIEKIEGIGNELHLHIKSNKISNENLLELIGIFDRYKFKSDQLKVFKNENNKKWFE